VGIEYLLKLESLSIKKKSIFVPPISIIRFKTRATPYPSLN
jgi:hypothetical protein